MKKLLFVLTSHGQKGSTGERTGFYVPEAAYPWAVLGHDFVIDFVSPLGGEPPMDGVDSADSVVTQFLQDQTIQKKLKTTLTPSQIQPNDYVGLLFVGGHGAMWDFPQDVVLQAVTQTIYEQGGIVAAVCHGSAGLVNVRLSNGAYLVTGKRVAAFSDEEERAVGLAHVVPFLLASQLQERDAIYVGAPNWQENVVVDERLVTGQNPASARGVAQAMLKLLKA